MAGSCPLHTALAALRPRVCAQRIHVPRLLISTRCALWSAHQPHAVLETLNLVHASQQDVVMM